MIFVHAMITICTYISYCERTFPKQIFNILFAIASFFCIAFNIGSLERDNKKNHDHSPCPFC